MSKSGFFIFSAALLQIALFMACGSSSRQLQSLSISPGSGTTQVQFNAIGSFAGSGHTAAVNALWWTSQPWTYPPTPFLVSVSSSGLAQCQTTAVAGTYTIYAVAPVNPSLPLSQMSMSTPQVSATAQITCP